MNGTSLSFKEINIDSNNGYNDYLFIYFIASMKNEFKFLFPKQGTNIKMHTVKDQKFFHNS